MSIPVSPVLRQDELGTISGVAEDGGAVATFQLPAAEWARPSATGLLLSLVSTQREPSQKRCPHPTGGARYRVQRRARDLATKWSLHLDLTVGSYEAALILPHSGIHVHVSLDAIGSRQVRAYDRAANSHQHFGGSRHSARTSQSKSGMMSGSSVSLRTMIMDGRRRRWTNTTQSQRW